MASTWAKQNRIILFTKTAFLLVIITSIQGCKGNKLTYTSNCDEGIAFKKVKFNELVAHIKAYDQQYIEVSGTYMESKEQSALYNDSLFTDHSNKHALWINFSQDCPLYLKGTRTGLFEPTNGEFVLVSNKKLKIRGKIDLRNTGHLGQYCAAIDRISFVEFK